MNWKLILSILSSINGGLITGAALFNPLIGQSASLKVISVLGICQIIVSSINSNLSTLVNTVKSVAAVTGDDGKPAIRVGVNSNAGPALATVALDPAQQNVGATTPEVREALKEVVKAAS